MMRRTFCVALGCATALSVSSPHEVTAAPLTVRGIRVVDIEDCSTLNERLFEHPNGLYRGMSNASFDLVSSLHRLVGDTTTGDKAWQLEQGLLASFQKYYPRGGQQLVPSTTWEWIALAEHHGLPTRMFNFSHSPFVALHFATLGSPDVDGAVWCVDPLYCHQQSPHIADWISGHPGEAGAGRVLTVNALTALLSDLPHQTNVPGTLLAPLSPLQDGVVFVEPPTTHNRAVAQQHVYGVMSTPQQQLGEWLDRNPGAAFIIRIPARLKPEVRRRLDVTGVHEGTINGDTDGLCAWLRRYYDPKSIST